MALINDRIRQRRIEMGLTLKEVAEDLGVKEATVQRYESGAIKSIGHETIIELSDILHTNPSYLMGWNDKVLNIDNGKRLARMSAVDTIMLNYFEKIKALPQYQRELIYNMIDNMAPPQLHNAEQTLHAAHEKKNISDEAKQTEEQQIQEQMQKEIAKRNAMMSDTES